MPSEREIAFPLKDDKITLFAEFFRFCNFLLPITIFCKSMLDEYAVYISQMHPLGLAKLRHFEYACLSLGFLPEPLVFRALYSLVWKTPFFTFDRRSTDETCLRLVPASCRGKDWKKKFFYVDANVIPGEMHWRAMSAKEKVKDVAPPKAEYQENALFKALTTHPSEITIVPDGALALVGMSLCWRDVQIYPALRTADGSPFTRADLLYPERSSSILAADRPLHPGEDNILRANVSNFLISPSHMDRVL
ncbi:hypothetical protein HanRHA438_Chr05g0206751 [Helianthus annuus]|uniref:Uncharacterized protein n=1 Tax=Helianthus annuus TaxID=4232 RepID=A0A9K3IWM0_HELAN|nr:hypothetical protein HanXRQr2_Chr05g0197271 [Helianthus annuus]KAJ0569093.1 hypothetical protein HanHA300_Chr05g0162111 [Helianthus annuus]KAJ0575452.1 hypothetical protein HanIR_Chr05g0212881 [Helianthus annuus]KAJ0583372.1 hypothetical protein HanHA89_Chr05g0175791 [Helianthus annuus]KAJ0746109.1 hypothetical protein HanOQP8_Chr05g0173741 [Helianthus annuus]